VFQSSDRVYIFSSESDFKTSRDTELCVLEKKMVYKFTEKTIALLLYLYIYINIFRKRINNIISYCKLILHCRDLCNETRRS